MRVRTSPDLAAGGDAVARAPDGRVMFVSGAAPDETVEVEITDDNPTFLRAHVVAVVQPGTTRAAPPCPYYGTCGGCTLQHVDPAEQTRSKQSAVLETLARIGKIDVANVEVAPAWTGASQAYRARARLAYDPVTRAVGFRAARSRDVVSIERCLVLVPALQAALDRVQEAAASAAAPGTAAEIEVIAANDRALVALPRNLQPLAAAFRQDDVVRIADRGDTLAIEDDAGKLLLSPHAFAQANPAGNRAMVEHVRALAAPGAPHAEVLELYAGSGNFTRVLAPLATRLRTFESANAAASLARRVLPRSVEVRADPVERALGRLRQEGARPDVVLLDPPRAGATPAVIDGLAALAPRTVIYVSCDPATFARDAGRLAAKGALALDHLRIFDLYPHTAHVELIGRLTRRST